MHFSLLIALLMASVGSLLDASPSPITNTPSTKVLKRDDDPAYSGNYAIKACGDRVSLVKTLLESTYESLVQAMDLLPTPVGNGGGSIVYNAFFNGVDPALVKSLYQHMTAGTNVTINRRPFNPTVVCVNDQDPRLVMRKASAACASTSEGTTMGLALRGSPYVFLCPLWTQVHLFPLPYMCGTVGRLNTLTSPVNLATTQYGNLVHVLAHLYLGNSLSPKVMLPNDCIALPPSQSVINPQSYAFYAAYLKAGCKQYPSRQSPPSTPQQPDHDLLEVDVSEFNTFQDLVPSPACATVSGNATIETFLDVC